MFKKCNCCGKIHNEVPKNARVWKEEGILVGWVWECECKSSLLLLADKVKELQTGAF